MYILRPSYRYLIIRQIVLSLCFTIFLVAVSLITSKYKTFNVILVLSLSIIYFFVILVYKPIKYKNTCYILKKTSIQLHVGIIFKSETLIPLNSIDFISIRQSLIQKIDNSFNLIIYAKRHKTILRNLTYHSINMLKIRINSKIKGNKV